MKTFSVLQPTPTVVHLLICCFGQLACDLHCMNPPITIDNIYIRTRAQAILFTWIHQWHKVTKKLTTETPESEIVWLVLLTTPENIEYVSILQFP